MQGNTWKLHLLNIKEKVTDNVLSMIKQMHYEIFSNAPTIFMEE